MDKDRIHAKLQDDLIALIRVLDECMDEIDSLYCKAKKEEMLCCSNNN